MDYGVETVKRQIRTTYAAGQNP